MEQNIDNSNKFIGDKIDADELTQHLKITNKEAFVVYLKEIWRVSQNILNHFF